MHLFTIIINYNINDTHNDFPVYKNNHIDSLSFVCVCLCVCARFSLVRVFIFYKCCQEKRACINCFPGERGKCVNIVNIVSSIPPQTTKQVASERCHLGSPLIKVAACDSSMSLSTQALIPATYFAIISAT